MTSRHSPRSFLGALLTATLALTAGCANHVPTATQPCPCAVGYVCCQSGVCAQSTDLCDEATSALSVQARGSWTGHLESYAGFPSRADSVAISLDVASDGSLEGKVTLGDAPPPTPPTSKDQIWPPGLTPGVSAMDAPSSPIEGFTYQAHDVTWVSRRLRFSIQLSEPWKPWCELQSPYDANANATATGGEPAWRCAPISGIVPSDATTCQLFEDTPTESRPCAVVDLCQSAGHPCLCTAAGCTAGGDAMSPSSFAATASFDVSLDGDQGDGTFTNDGTNNNVRLVRSSH
jgi:hypothetical protein